MTYAEANPSNLVVSDLNERKHDTDPSDEFIDDVRANGVEDPILVRETGDPEHEYEVVAGQLRLKAAIETDQDTVPVEIRDLNDSEAYRESIRENYRGDLGKDVAPLDRAKAIQEWWESSTDDDSKRPSTTAVAEAFGISASTASRWIEPLRDEWADLRAESKNGNDADFHRENPLNSVGGSTLQEIRKIDGSTSEQRTGLVERVAAGDETRDSITDLKERVNAGETDMEETTERHEWDGPGELVSYWEPREMGESGWRRGARVLIEPSEVEQHWIDRQVFGGHSLERMDIRMAKNCMNDGVPELLCGVTIDKQGTVLYGWRDVILQRAAGARLLPVDVFEPHPKAADVEELDELALSGHIQWALVNDRFGGKIDDSLRSEHPEPIEQLYNLAEQRRTGAKRAIHVGDEPLETLRDEQTVQVRQQWGSPRVIPGDLCRLTREKKDSYPYSSDGRFARVTEISGPGVEQELPFEELPSPDDREYLVAFEDDN
jgi:ParB family chromosome partitioning protein